MMKKKILVATTYDISNPKAWPIKCFGNWGSTLSIVEGLKKDKGLEISIYFPKSLFLSILTILLKFKRLFYSFVKINHHLWADRTLCYFYTKKLESHLSKNNYDLIIFTESFHLSGFIKTDIPFIIWADIAIYSIIDKYKYLQNMSPALKQNIFALEQLAYSKSTQIITTSVFSKSQILSLYEIPDDKVHIIRRGSNFELATSFTDNQIDHIIDSRPSNIINLLFLGVDWERKGGSLVVDLVERLNNSGVPSHLNIIGCTPSIESENIIIHGFLNKYDTSQEQLLISLIQQSHYLVLPISHDINPHVITEANSFGVPVLAPDLMGISTVLNDENGYVSPDNTLQSYYDFIINSFPSYKELAKSSFLKYKRELSWDIAIAHGKTIIQGITPNHLAQNK